MRARYSHGVAGDGELLALIFAMHLVMLVFAALLFRAFLRSDTVEEWSPVGDSDDGDDGPGSDRLRPRAPNSPRDGGLPLPDAAPARLRLRDHERLGDRLPRPARRPGHAPERDPAPR